jgi:uncharacterized membrane protein YukC
MGVDREKIKEIEARMQAIENDDSLSDEQKQQQLKQLEKEKQQLLAHAQEQMIDNEKSKSAKHQIDFTQRLAENRLRV